MSVPIALRQILVRIQLRGGRQKTKDGPQALRLLTLAVI